VLGVGFISVEVGEMLFHIRRRTKQDLPSSPLHKAMRTVRPIFEIGRFQNAHHLHRQRGAGSVIGGAGAVMPRDRSGQPTIYQFVGLGAAGISAITLNESGLSV